jgi:uncharacterized protein with NAD-binding domain and iron-sulfur cluster
LIADGALGRYGAADPVFGSLVAELRRWQDEIDRRLERRVDGRRLSTVVDLVTAAVRGVVADGLLGSDRGFGAVDDEDFRDWLSRHGARPSTCDSGLVRGMYDLVFAYEDGDPGRPRFAAGQGLELAARFFFDHKGAIFWKMTAGMGDVVIAPLYEALRRRGVRFELSCEVERLELRPDRPDLAAVHLRRAPRRPGDGQLVRFDGIPCFTEADRASRPSTQQRSTLRLGEDVDTVVLAMSIGAIPFVAPDLLATDERWATMCRTIGTVATRAAQVWFDESEADLGLANPGVTTSGWGPPFDTYASMSHLLDVEPWTDRPKPRGLAYLCGVLPDGGPERDGTVDEDLAHYLREGVERVLPRSHDRDGLRSGIVADTFTTRPTHASDRYVQSLPGTRADRLGAGGSGVTGLVLAGDWTRTGLDAGCIEAAVISGIQAANVVLGRSVDDTVLGGWTAPRMEEARV